MCGIAGGYKLEREQVEEMSQALSHRGPDGFGYFSCAGFSMGMARLMIQGGTEAKQPFVSEDGKVQVVFNGELYNWRSIRKELEREGCRFKTECDGEILPAAWKKWGGEMWSRLNGMFAVAIFEVDSGELILGRDHCPNRERVAGYLMNRYVSEPDTLFNEVKTLQAGHWVRVNAAGRMEHKRYWSPLSGVERCDLSQAEAMERLEKVTRKSVEQTMQTEWKGVLYLSSGVDSSMLGHYLSELRVMRQTRQSSLQID